MNFNKQKCITAVILLLVAILSITVIGKYASSPENHQKTIASLDEKKQTVMELTAASTVTSALITLLPGDTATPIAEKMADVSGYLLVVLCAIYLEKYLVTITGYVAFTYLIPIACGLWIFNLIFANATVRKLATKLAVFGLAISFVVPASVKISDLIGDTYQAQIEATIEDAKNTQSILENSGVVDFVRRIPVDIFEKWYADQDVYRKVTHIPTAEELENDYICLQDAADLLGISREKLAKIARSEEIGRLLDSTICNNKRWITRKSFQLFLNAQNVYYILDDGDEQEKDTVSLEIKEYISRQEAAELAGVSVSTVTKWMQSGEFQCVGAGKVLRVHRQQFLNWLNEHREGVI